MPTFEIKTAHKFVAELKRNAADASWTEIERLDPYSWSTALPPDLGRAILLWKTGQELDVSDGAGGAAGYQPHDWFPDPAETAHDFVARMDGAYVRIIEIVPGDPTDTRVVRWIGIIAETSRDEKGDDTGAVSQPEPPIGEQHIQCVSIEYLLDRRTINRAYAVSREIDASGYTVVPGLDEVVQIDRCPVFNQTYSSRHSQSNRTTPALVGSRWDDVHAFAEDPPPNTGNTPGAWSHAEIAAYLLRFWQPAQHVKDSPTGFNDIPIDVDSDEIQFICNDFGALFGRNDVVEQEGRTLFEMFSELASREVGLQWYCRIANSDGPGLTVEVVFDTVFASTVTFGGQTIPANTDQVDVNVSGSPGVLRHLERRDYRRQVDVIRVRGDFCVTCFSVGYWDGTLEQGWTLALEEEYEQALMPLLLLDDDMGDPVDSDDQDRQAAACDAFRNEDRFARVYRRFRIPNTFNWMVGTTLDPDISGPLPPVNRNAAPFIYPETGTVDVSEQQTMWRHRRPVRPMLPFRVGYDYSTDPPTPLVPDADQTELIPIQAWIIDRGIGSIFESFPHPTINYPRYISVTERLDRAETVSPRQLDARTFGNAHVRAVDDEFAVEISYPFPHALARSDWHGRDTLPKSGWSDFEPKAWGLDWEDMIVTIAVKTDQRLSVEQLVVPPHQPPGTPIPTVGYPPGPIRELTIDVPDARLIYVVPGTVFGMDMNGVLKRTPDPQATPPPAGKTPQGVMQNDYARLEQIAAVAANWYQIERLSVSLEVSGTDVPTDTTGGSEVRVGQLVKKFDPGAAQEVTLNTVIERIVVNVADTKGEVGIQTGAATIDPVQVVRRAG